MFTTLQLSSQVSMIKISSSCYQMTQTIKSTFLYINNDFNYRIEGFTFFFIIASCFKGKSIWGSRLSKKGSIK